MSPSVTTSAANSQRTSSGTSSNSAFSTIFINHARVSYFRVSPDKVSPSRNANPQDMPHWAFFTPARSVGSALVVDVDRPEAVTEIYETIPAEIHPSWVVETRKGAQAGWLIDPVDLRDTARERPIHYARSVGSALRQAVGGDEAVDPLTPSRVRNPAYYGADLRAPATPPVYGFRELHQALKLAELWPTGPSLTGRRPHVAARAEATAAMTTGNRNQTIFDVARHAAYAGEDFAAVAWDTNDACAEPLPGSEVHGIIRSISRYVSRGHGSAGAVAMPDTMREALTELGRRGGSANTAAQRAARALGPTAAARKRMEATDKNAHKAQRMRGRGHSRKAICEALKVSASTVCRWLRRLLPRSRRGIAPLDHQVFRAGQAALKRQSHWPRNPHQGPHSHRMRPRRGQSPSIIWRRCHHQQ